MGVSNWDVTQSQEVLFHNKIDLNSLSLKTRLKFKKIREIAFLASGLKKTVTDVIIGKAVKIMGHMAH